MLSEVVRSVNGFCVFTKNESLNNAIPVLCFLSANVYSNYLINRKINDINIYVAYGIRQTGTVKNAINM